MKPKRAKTIAQRGTSTKQKLFSSKYRFSASSQSPFASLSSAVVLAGQPQFWSSYARQSVEITALSAIAPPSGDGSYKVVNRGLRVESGAVVLEGVTPPSMLDFISTRESNQNLVPASAMANATASTSGVRLGDYHHGNYGFGRV